MKNTKTIYIQNNLGWENLKLHYWYKHGDDTWTNHDTDGIVLTEENGVYKILRPNEDKVALFCHTVMGRLWISRLLHIPIHLMWAGFQMTHTGVTVIEFKNNENGVTAPYCRCFSDMSHLYAAGLEMIHDNTIEV